jgi:2,5-diamino-6-(ribosylamino)-4(3H)-pyrimidinone 5'-phosphate reductase
MRPYVYLVSAMTVDGRIASKTGYSRLSCPHDLRRLHEMRARVDAVIIGANTAIIDNPRLTVRHALGRNPARVLIDGALRVPTALRLFDSSAPTIVFTTRRAPEERVRELRGRGVEVVIAGDELVDPRQVLRELYARGMGSVMVEGGGRTNWEFLSRCLVDEIVVTVTPYVLGRGVSLVEGDGYPTVGDAPFSLELLSVVLCECGGEVVLTYRVRCREGA